MYQFNPSISQLGDRILSQTSLSSDASTIKEYHIHRMKCGIAESTEELPPGQCLPFEVNLDFMNGGMKVLLYHNDNLLYHF